MSAKLVEDQQSEPDCYSTTFVYIEII